MLVETKIDSSVTSGSLHQPGYFLNRQDRTDKGGGVATFINESLQPKTLLDLQTKYSSNDIEVTVDLCKRTFAKGCDSWHI